MILQTYEQFEQVAKIYDEEIQTLIKLVKIKTELN